MQGRGEEIPFKEPAEESREMEGGDRHRMGLPGPGSKREEFSRKRFSNAPMLLRGRGGE